MNKGLEQFNKLKTWYVLKMVEGNELLLRDNEKEMLYTIEKELKEYEQYKAIEQEIGIDLITLVKTLKNGCYVKPWKEIKYTYEIRTGSDNINLFLLDENDNDYSLKDYGKTWALTKEELE